MVEYRHVTVPVRDGKFQVQVVEGGTGDSLIFLHGEDGLTEWTPFLDRLAQHFHVYAPAHPGQGGTQGLQHLDDLWDLVLFYEELMQALGLERAHAIGHSYGGMLAAELAAHRPDKVSRLVLINSLGLWLNDAPIADFFILTAEELAKTLWFDSECDAAKAAFAQPSDPEEKMESDLARTETLAAVAAVNSPTRCGNQGSSYSCQMFFSPGITSLANRFIFLKVNSLGMVPMCSRHIR